VGWRTLAADPIVSRPNHGHRIRVAVRVLATALATILAAVLAIGPAGVGAVSAADKAVVRAVLFYSPTCPHCHQVMTQDLPPIQATYGDALEVLTIDVTEPTGADVYGAAIERFGIPENRIGVPTLIVGDTVLVGSVEIPQLLPSLVELLIADGGSEWPAIPGLAALVPGATLEPGATAPAAGSVVPTAGADGPESGAAAGSLDGGAGTGSGMLDNAARDPAGSSLAVGILAALLVVLAWSLVALYRSGWQRTAGAHSVMVPVLAVLGLVVAAYLSSVELSGTTAVCGPVGDCNAVHASPYARLLGVPVGLLGVAGYVAILALWLAVRFGGPSVSGIGAMGIVAAAAVGSAFSAYLTFLEPFVIGATCAWCLASAVLMGAILVTAVAPAPRVSSRARPV